MKTRRVFFILILTISLVLINVASAFAGVPVLPSSFYGTVKLDGANIPAGTTVTVWINGVKYADANLTTYQGDTVYFVDVPGDDVESTPIEGGANNDTVVFHVNDLVTNPTGLWKSGTNVELNLTAQSNAAPVITEGPSVAVTMSKNGTPTAFDLTLHATDANSGDTLTWSISGQPTNGAATASGTGLSRTIGYTPNTNYVGSDSFIVQVSDGKGGTDTITVNVTIQATNTAPVITEGGSTGVTMSEDGSPTAFSLTLHATDADTGTTLTWSISTAAANGTATASGSGTSKVINYTPNANYSGSDSFVVQVSDGSLVDTIIVNVTISAVNDAPVIIEGASTPVTMSEDGSPTAFSLTLHATDADTGSTLTWSISTAAANGTATASGTGASKVIGYAPNANFNGSDSFVVRVSDGTLNDTITVNVTINAVNDAPVITEGATTGVTMSEDGSPTAFSLTLHATDADTGSTLTWSISTAAANGTATASGTGASKVINYTPNANYNGSDSFVVRVADGNGGSDTITINVTINAVNDAPVITEGATTGVTMSEDGSPTAFSLTLHATDADAGATLTWSISSAAANGTATASGTGSSKAIGYTPNTNFNGSDSFVVQVSDGSLTDTIIVNVTINAINDAPVCSAVALHSLENTAGDTAPSCSDADGNTLTYSIVAQGSNGTASVVSNMLHFVPASGYTGTDLFTYRASDGTANSNTANVNVTITAGNVAPVITEGATTGVTMSEDGSPTAFSLTLHATDADAGNTLTWSISTAATNGTATASGTGTSKVINYTPNANYNGSDSFVVQVSDGLLSDTILVNVTINAVNDAPVITEGAATAVTMSENGSPTAFSLTLHATDADSGATLTWSISSAAANGTATASGTGSSKAIGYTPNTNFNGSDSFVVQVSDGSLTDTIIVNVTIAAVNNAPVITEGASTAVTMSEDGSPTAFSLTLHATDADAGDTLTWNIATAALHGTATSSGTGNSKDIGYAPDANYNGSDSFVVEVSDGALIDTITVNVTISQVNDAPVLAAIIDQVVKQGKTISFTTHATDIDVPAQTLTFALEAGAPTGATIHSQSGVFNWTPATNQATGSYPIMVTVTDNGSPVMTDSKTFKVTVTSGNQAPTATEDSYQVNQDGVLTVAAPGVLENDSDADGDTLSAQIITTPAHGVLTWNGDGAFVYTPAAGFNGTDTFTYKASDGTLTSPAQTVTIQVQPLVPPINIHSLFLPIILQQP